MVQTLQGFKIESVSNPGEPRDDVETACGGGPLITSYTAPRPTPPVQCPTYSPCDPVVPVVPLAGVVFHLPTLKSLKSQSAGSVSGEDEPAWPGLAWPGTL